MSKIPKTNYTSLYGWDTYRLSSERIQLAIAPAIGGRIISLKFDEEEWLFVQEEHLGETFDFSKVKDWAREKELLGFRLWGGDKTWVAPQKEWLSSIPPLTLDAGPYQCEPLKIPYTSPHKSTSENPNENLSATGIVLKSSMDPETGLQIVRKITLREDHSVLLSQSFSNLSSKTVSKGIWNVTQILRDIFVYLPVSCEKIISYPDEGDSQGLKKEMVEPIGKHWSRIRCDSPCHFKYGASLSSFSDSPTVPSEKEGRLLTAKPSRRKKDFLVMDRLFSVTCNAPYAHESAMVEVYNSPTMDYAEAEVHSPLYKIEPCQTVEHSQLWKWKRLSLEALEHELSLS